MPINWGGKTIYLPIPWWLGILVVAFIFFLIVAIRGKGLAEHTWRCPNCGHGFKKKWFQLMLISHINDYYGLKCPECKKRDLYSHRN